MARTTFVAGNWKMHMTRGPAEELAIAVKTRLNGRAGVDVAVCPPFTALDRVAGVLRGSEIALGAQNMCWEEEGAFTGEVSAPMLKDIGCRYVILGHSERRSIFGESDKTVNSKVKAALHHSLRPILCVGETLEEREADRAEEVVGAQLNGSLADIAEEQLAHVTLAYEPVWAIGTGKTATPDQAQAMHKFVRGRIADAYSASAAETLRIQYGGSVKPGNAADLFAQPDIDGGLIGGASLKADDFVEICMAGVGEV